MNFGDVDVGNLDFVFEDVGLDDVDLGFEDLELGESVSIWNLY